jgi:hypothetical protein
VLGLGAAFLRDSFDDRLTSKEATEHAGGAPVLAMTRRAFLAAAAPLVVTVTEPNSRPRNLTGRCGPRCSSPGRSGSFAACW